MKKIFFIVFLYSLVVTNSIIFAQSFQNTYGSTRNEEGIASIAVGDGYVILGDIETNGRKDLYLSKIDENGELVWQKKYGQNNSEENSWHLIKTSDNGFLISASTTDNGGVVERMLLIKTDNTGIIEWQKTYRYSNYVAPTYALELANGEYMITGYFAFDLSKNNRSGMVVRISATGDIIWCKAYHNAALSGGSVNQYFIGIRQTQNGNFVIPTAYGGNSSGTPSGRYDNAITCIDGNGNIVWGKRFGDSDNDEFRVILPISATETIVAGSYRGFPADLDMGFCKVNQSGTITQRKRFGGAGLERVFYATATADRSKLYFVGYTSSVGGGDRDMLVLCTDINGNYLWSKAFGGAGFEEARSVILTNDGNGVVIIGRTTSFGEGQNDIYIVKMHNATSTQCKQTDFIEPIENITGAVSDITFDITSINLTNGNAINETSSSLVKNSTCCVGSVFISGVATIPCSATSTTLSAPNGYSSYLWTLPNGTTLNTQTIRANAAGIYRLQVENTTGCKFYDSLQVNFIQIEKDLIKDNFEIKCINQSIEVSLNGEFREYLWIFPNGETSNEKTISVHQEGIYKIIVIDEQGCQFEDSTEVKIINPALTEESVMNVITPNNDGFNDTFVFPTENAKLSIYSRWEEKVYESDKYQHNWKANNLPSGMYFVIAYDTCSDSEVRLWIHVIKE